MTPAGLYAIAVLRIAIAWCSYSPRHHRGHHGRSAGWCVIVIIFGLTTPWFGVARTWAVLNWLAGAGPLPMRLDASWGWRWVVFPCPFVERRLAERRNQAVVSRSRLFHART